VVDRIENLGLVAGLGLMMASYLLRFRTRSEVVHRFMMRQL